MALLSIMGLYKYDNTIFEPLEVPEGVEKDTLIGLILAECAELECVIPDTEVFKTVINYWSKKNQQPWTKIYEAQTAEYNPLWNKDGHYTELETRNLHSDGETIGQVSAFNSEDYANGSRQTAEGNDSGTVERDRREYGNIGVTTSTQMLTEEMTFRQSYNIYDIITEDFKSRFCIMVY